MIFDYAKASKQEANKAVYYWVAGNYGACKSLLHRAGVLSGCSSCGSLADLKKWMTFVIKERIWPIK
jgi:hypothetical protein